MHDGNSANLDSMRLASELTEQRVAERPAAAFGPGHAVLLRVLGMRSIKAKSILGRVMARTHAKHKQENSMPGTKRSRPLRVSLSNAHQNNCSLLHP